MAIGIKATLAFLLIVAVVGFTTQLRAQDAATTYKAKCAMCHGADGKGDTPAGKKMGARDFASPEVQKASDADLTQIIEKGKNKMPAYTGKLTAAQIKDLVAYVRQFGKGK